VDFLIWIQTKFISLSSSEKVQEISTQFSPYDNIVQTELQAASLNKTLSTRNPEEYLLFTKIITAMPKAEFKTKLTV
jgi:hypothetical protein